KFKYLAVIFTFIFLILNVNLLFRSYNPFGFNNKMLAAKYGLLTVGENDFSLDTLSSCFRWDGFYYPFIFEGRHPVKSYQDPNYAWLYDYQVSASHPSRIIVEVPKGRFETEEINNIYNRYQQW